uniref:Uncharacterized protein n=1 Tax=Anguilla anguilla TaxID=7936 RepID=A0A0E9QGL7_ANGAN
MSTSLMETQPFSLG